MNSEQARQQGADSMGKAAQVAGKAGTKVAKRLGKSKAFKKLMKKLAKFLIRLIATLAKAILAYIGPIGILVIVAVVLLGIILDSIPGADWFMEGGKRTAKAAQIDKAYEKKFRDLSDSAVSEVYDIEASETWIAEVRSLAQVSWGLPVALVKYRMIHADKFGRDMQLPSPEEFISQLKPTFTYTTVRGDIEYSKTSKVCKQVKEIETQVMNSQGQLVPSKTLVTTGTAAPVESAVQTKEGGQKKILAKISTMFGDIAVNTKDEKTDWEVESVETQGDCQVTTYKKYDRTVIDDSGSPAFTPDPNRIATVLSGLGVKEKDYQFVLQMAKAADPSFPLDKIGGTVSIGNMMGGVFGYTGVPGNLIEIYKSAEAAFGVDWYILGGIHWIETNFSKDLRASSVGAIGHMQFMKKTWLGWGWDGGTRLGDASIPNDILTNPAMIAKYGGAGIDGDKDGKADPMNIVDAVFGAANYLKKAGYQKGNDAAIYKAIFSYNHADWYVRDVLRRAQIVLGNPSSVPGGSSAPGSGQMPALNSGFFTRPAAGAITSGFGNRSGGMHYGVDIGSGGISGKPIVAAADGKVVRSYRSSSYGECIIIGHSYKGQYIETLYAHMITGSRKVSEGSLVKKGQVIGTMGNTGASEGVHLHFEVHIGGWTQDKGHAVNPLTYVPF